MTAAGPSADLRVVVVDDEPMARSALRALLVAEDGVDLVAECANGREALAVVRTARPDLLFLDVEMPGMTGLEVLAELSPSERPAVIFTTAFAEYAVDAFEFEALDYLKKPFDDERFAEALRRARERLRAAPTAAGDAPLADRISIHREGRLELVEVSKLEWVEAADQYVRLHTDEGEHLMRESMGQLEQRLDPQRFLRVHRSAIVAVDRIRRLESRGGGVGRVLLASGQWVPVSRSRFPLVRRALG